MKTSEEKKRIKRKRIRHTWFQLEVLEQRREFEVLCGVGALVRIKHLHKAAKSKRQRIQLNVRKVQCKKQYEKKTPHNINKSGCTQIGINENNQYNLLDSSIFLG
jgi:hypothetical protein